MATNGTENASDEIKSIACCVCAKKNLKSDAETYCTHCQDYYCAPCTDMHKLFPSMSGHKLLDKCDFSNSSVLLNLPCFPTEYCFVHKTRLLEMFCKDHDQIICPTCVALNHRNCKDVHSIPDEVDSLYKQASFDETSKQLHNLQKAMEEIKKAKESLIETYKEYKNIAKDFVEEFIQEIKDILEELETESTMRVATEYENFEAKLQKAAIEAGQCIDEIKQSAIKSTNSLGNKAQKFVCAKFSEKTIGKMKKTESLLRKENHELDNKCFVDSELVYFLEQLNERGQVKLERYRVRLC